MPSVHSSYSAMTQERMTAAAMLLEDARNRVDDPGPHNNTRQPAKLDAVTLVTAAVAIAREAHLRASITTDLARSAPVCALADVAEAIVELVENAVRHVPTTIQRCECRSRLRAVRWQ